MLLQVAPTATNCSLEEFLEVLRTLPAILTHTRAAARPVRNTRYSHIKLSETAPSPCS